MTVSPVSEGGNAARGPRGRVGCRRASEKEMAILSSCGNVNIHYDFVGMLHRAVVLASCASASSVGVCVRQTNL